MTKLYSVIGRVINNILNSVNFKLVRIQDEAPDIHSNAEFMEMFEKCAPFTMTSVERMYALYEGLNYILENKIAGDFVECGVWRGGSAMLMAMLLKKYNVVDRKIFLYDTYEGMTAPGTEDVSYNGESAAQIFSERSTGADSSDWCLANMKEVKKNLLSTGVKEEQMVLIKGKVESTIPGEIPKGDIALLRLDTDWYASTKHELIHLYPKLRKGGILIIDDYGHWEGARKATQEYFKETNQPILLNRVDYSCRIGTKN